MGIILGFGNIEEKVRQDIKNLLINALIEGKNINNILKEYNKKADEYDKLPKDKAPERYTRVWFYDKKLTFHHINRRHPFSPDGWALLEVEEKFGDNND